MVIYYYLKWYHLIPQYVNEGVFMEIKTELLKSHISNYISSQIHNFEIDADEITNTVAIKMLSEIQDILKNDNYSDFEIVEEIVCVFEKHKIDFGNRHDF